MYFERGTAFTQSLCPTQALGVMDIESLELTFCTCSTSSNHVSQPGAQAQEQHGETVLVHCKHGNLQDGLHRQWAVPAVPVGTEYGLPGSATFNMTGLFKQVLGEHQGISICSGMKSDRPGGQFLHQTLSGLSSNEL